MNTRRILHTYGRAILVSVGVALFIRFFLIEAYRIPSSSAMKPTLLPGDLIFVEKRPLLYSTFKHGDVVIFSPPIDPRRDYLKRIVALSGDTVEIQKGRLILNGKNLTISDEQKSSCKKENLPGNYVHELCIEQPFMDHFGPQKIPEGSVFVLGDLRNNQQTGGIIPTQSIKAKALWVWLSSEPSRIFHRIQ